MFDIGVSELFVIGVVALVVIGPEKLPRVARTIGHLTGRLQRYVNDVKADINREIELDELRRFKQEVEQTAHSFESAVRTEVGKTESELNQAAEHIAGAAQPALSESLAPPSPGAESLEPALGSPPRDPAAPAGPPAAGGTAG
jgi:sec-independent protein translocase protein TatB